MIRRLKVGAIQSLNAFGRSVTVVANLGSGCAI